MHLYHQSKIDMMICHYIKYNYCELHPSLLLGEIIANAPFCNMNTGHRNIFQYAHKEVRQCVFTQQYHKQIKY